MNSLSEEIRAQLDGTRNLYHRLVLVVGPAGSGKTAALQALCETNGISYVNLNLALSQRLLEYASKARPLRLRTALDEVILRRGADIRAILRSYGVPLR